MDIQAAVERELNAPVHIETVQLSEPQDDEVLVRICAVGVCHTDVAAGDGHLPINTPAVLGHEGADVVERVGASVTKVQPGDKVVLTFIYCGRCENCRRGDVAYCEDAMASPMEASAGTAAPPSASTDSRSSPISPANPRSAPTPWRTNATQ